MEQLVIPRFDPGLPRALPITLLGYKVLSVGRQRLGPQGWRGRSPGPRPSNLRTSVSRASDRLR